MFLFYVIVFYVRVDIGNRSKLKHLLLGGCLIISYNFLMKLVKLKYDGEKESPFEKHRFLMCAYLVALIMVGVAFAMLGYDYGCSLYKKSFPRHVYKVVKILMYFSGIIALLSVILMLITD